MTKFFSNKKSICCFFLISVSFSFYSCNKCKEEQSGYYNFTSQELQINPYNGQEVFLFQSLSGDSLHFSTGDRTSNMSQYYPNHENECKGNYHWLETNNIVISSNVSSWQFSIMLKTIPSRTSNTHDNVITFTASIPEQSRKALSQRTLFFKQDTITGYEYKYGPDLILYTSLNLGSKSFTDVFEINLLRDNETEDYWVNKLYYTINQGIVGFSTQPNELWFLDK